MKTTWSLHFRLARYTSTRHMYDNLVASFEIIRKGGTEQSLKPVRVLFTPSLCSYNAVKIKARRQKCAAQQRLAFCRCNGSIGVRSIFCFVAFTRSFTSCPGFSYHGRLRGRDRQTGPDANTIDAAEGGPARF